MSTIIDDLKSIIGYTEEHKQCKDCNFFEPDDTTDNFGPGDRCGRNPDVKFPVRQTAVCIRWKPKST